MPKSAKLIITRGIPASGKSTWARNHPQADIIIERDIIRKELNFPEGYNRRTETLVVTELTNRILRALYDGLVVINSDCNLTPKHEDRMRELAYQMNASFEIKEFPISLNSALERNQLRYPGPNFVPEKRIRQMYHDLITNYPHMKVD